MDSGKAFIAALIAIPLAVTILPGLFNTPQNHKVYRENSDGRMVEVTESQTDQSSQSSKYNDNYTDRYFADGSKTTYDYMEDAGYLNFRKTLNENGYGYITSDDKGPGKTYYIKGNISFSTGERIYHMPGDEYYDSTVIDESKGERWFSSEEEAQAAGWRRAYV